MDIDIVDDDLEILEILDHGIPRQVFNRPDLFHSYDDRAFFCRFRLTKETVLHMLPLLERYIERPYNRNNLVAPMNQLLITLMYFSSNSHMIIISDIGKMNKSTVCRIIKKVSQAIARLSQIYIKFPSNEATINETKNKFFDIASFPNVIGAVDGTHIRIQSPGHNDAEVFRNRKNYFSLNVQVIGNAKLEIIDLVARWPGSAHDATIFNNSNVRRRFENNQYPGCLLLGDSAYAMREFLLTPLQNPHNEADQLYNESHIRTRGTVEKLFGIWKRRFPILAYGCRLNLDNALTVIVATGVLYNIARKMQEQEPPLPGEIDAHEFQILLRNGDVPVVPFVNPNRLLGPQARNNLIQNYFANL